MYVLSDLTRSREVEYLAALDQQCRFVFSKIRDWACKQQQMQKAGPKVTSPLFRASYQVQLLDQVPVDVDFAGALQISTMESYSLVGENASRALSDNSLLPLLANVKEESELNLEETSEMWPL